MMFSPVPAAFVRAAAALMLASCAMLTSASRVMPAPLAPLPSGLAAQVVQAAEVMPDTTAKARAGSGDERINPMVARISAAHSTGRLATEKQASLWGDRGPWQHPTPNAVVPAEPTVLTGSIAGAKYEIQVPAQWNGTLLLFSHGLQDSSETDNAAEVFADPGVGIWLLSNGYAVAGSGFRNTGWIIETAVQDQIALLDLFEQRFGRPRKTIAWGYSMGAVVTAALVQAHPGRIDGALPICGGMGGALGFWNAGLDTMYVLKTLVAPGDPLNLVRIADAAASYEGAQQLILRAQGTAQGQARLALAAAVGGIPGWFGPADLAEPGATEASVQEWHQFFWLYYYVGYMQTVSRRELEQRAGGNPSWNTGVNYSQLLDRSPQAQQVRTLYQQAGLSLASDLTSLAKAPRIEADLNAAAYLARNIIFDGQLGIPVVTLHTVADGITPVEHEQAYADVVQAAGRQHLLRQLYVRRAGHCVFTSAEVITSLKVLLRRLDTGTWDTNQSIAGLNAEATAFGAALNGTLGAHQAQPTFTTLQPSQFLRPFDMRSLTP